MQSSPSARPFKPVLAGASPATDAMLPRCKKSARRFAKAEARGANPRGSATLNSELRTPKEPNPSRQRRGSLRSSEFVPRTFPCPRAFSSYRASFVNSYSSVRVRPGAPAGLWCNSSISRCERDGPGANPGFLTTLGKANARRTLKEIGLSAIGFCSRSNPSPGTKISTPEFG